MKNRWSDAARAAALAVRKARAQVAQAANGLLGTKQNFNGVVPSLIPKGQGILPGVKQNFNGVVPSLIPGTPAKNVWIPPPNDPVWNDPKFVESFKRGVAERKKKDLTTSTVLPQPNIFYSSAYPYGPGQEGRVQGILRYDPKNPVDASKLGYNMGRGKKPMPPKRPPRGGGTKIPRVEVGRVIIGGKRYTRVGNKLTPDEVIPGQKSKVFYQK
jgi:hypothetical protein